MGRRPIRMLIGIGGVIFVVLLAFKLVGGIYSIPSGSMLPTLGIDSHVTALSFGDAEVGDIVIANPPAGAESDECGGGEPPPGQMCAQPSGGRLDIKFIKRVAAVGGDLITMRDGKLIRNGRPETARPLGECTDDGCDFPREITVPPGHLFLLGDNRGSSDDSRFWGPVPEDWVVGRLWFVINH